MRIALVALSLLLAACQSTRDEPPSYEYQLSAAPARSAVDTVLVVDMNHSEPPRRMLAAHEPRARDALRKHLEDQGFKVAPASSFNRAWRDAAIRHGDPVDPMTGLVDKQLRQAVLKDALAELGAKTSVDLVLFADIGDVKVLVSGTGIKRFGRWHGVTRQLDISGSGKESRTPFEWSEAFEAASLFVNVYDMKGQRIYQGAGGLDFLQEANLMEGRRVRARAPMGGSARIQEAVEAAMAPLLTAMK